MLENSTRGRQNGGIGDSSVPCGDVPSGETGGEEPTAEEFIKMCLRLLSTEMNTCNSREEGVSGNACSAVLV